MWNEPTEVELAKVPRLYETESIPVKDKIVHIHFFLASSDWYIVEFDGEDIFFGFACLNNWKDLAEWGYISFKELRELRVKQPIGIDGQRMLIPIEVDRDLNWISRKSFNVSLIRECQRW